MFALGLVSGGGGLPGEVPHVSGHQGGAGSRGLILQVPGPSEWGTEVDFPIIAALGACVSAGAPYRKPGSEALQRGPHWDGGLRSGVGRCV